MRYTLSADAPSTDQKTLVNILERAGTFDWMTLGIALPETSIEECLSWGVRDIDGVTGELGAIKARLASHYTAPAEDAPSAEPPAQVSWIRAAATALEPFPALAERAGLRAADLGELVDHDTILRATQLYAGRIKDGAIDARLLSMGYGWFVISTILDGLREEVQALPPREAEALLAPFSPLLVLVGQVMEERDALTKQTRGQTAALAAAVQEAQTERDAAEAALRRRAPKDVPRSALAEQAKKAAPALATPAPAGKTGRRTRR